MCGIAGFICANESTESREAAVRRMCTAMRHRGPDDDGIHSQGPATIGMQRLAIFDPAHGHQPMSTSEGRFHIVFNGAIYNFRELRTELTAAGITFKTNCDTEVLLAAFAHWGEKCLTRLRGMFAFAVWDTREQSLFFARDPFGIKPFYYGESNGRFMFASELNALLASGKCSADIDPSAASACLAYLAVPAPRTIYRGLRSLRPGECATFANGKLDVRTYWSFRNASTSEVPVCRSHFEFINELRSRLDDSIRAHCLADVPVGAFLSGGLDSSAIVGLMARQSGTRLKTFSIGFDEAHFSEAAEAAESAAHFGTEHESFTLTSERVVNDLDRILASYDQPTGDAVNTYYVSQVARAAGVTAALSGLGGDELFGGYPWFRTTPKMARWLPAWRLLPEFCRRPFLQRWQKGNSRQQKLADFLQYASNLHELAAMQRRNLSETRRRSLLSFDEPFAFHSELAHLPQETAGAEPFSVISAWEMRTYMADVLLRDSDVMSMRHSLELRVPFVDRPLLEWLWRQPASFKDTPAQPKSALAEALRDVLPPAIAQRKKRGFTLPFALWMRGPLKPFLEESFSSQSIGRSGLFNVANVQAFWHGFITTNDEREWSRVWSLAILIAFINRPRPATS